MWGATDSAYVLWMALRGPRLPLLATLRLALTVIDLHSSPLISFLISVLAFAASSWLSPEYYQTAEGVFVLSLQNSLASVFFVIGLATGATYEWYTGEIVAACRRDGLLGESITPHSSGVIEPGVGVRAAAAVSPTPRRSEGGAAAAPVAAVRPRGFLEATRSPWGTLARCSTRRAGLFLLRLLPWAIGPVIALFYFALPAIVAQTTLMCRNRQRSAHVSPKSSPTSNVAADHEDFFPPPADAAPLLVAGPRRRGASPAAVRAAGAKRRS